MCGIAGIVSLDGTRTVALEELAAMSAAMVHRGPDDEGFYEGTIAGLTMRRLSIIDLATGNQPVRNEDGSVWVVFNGEIYNFQELRDELLGLGHSFYTGTDTEVIVHLYEEHGPRCPEKLRGMFALAVWDERRRSLLLARDRLGIKPLYWGEVGGRLVFGSEVKTILQLPEVQRQLDWRAVNSLFTFQSTPPDQSIIRGIHKLEPGCVLTAGPGRPPRVERYWNVRFEPDGARSEADFVEELRATLDESVRLHMVSDVPLGAFLSGGIDSSSVVAAASRYSSGPLKTFSIGFREEDYDELRYARQVAERFGTDHHELVLQPDVLQVLDELSWYLDEPFGDPSAIPTYMVSKLASEHVTVVLSGDGGDELFAGYDKYVVESRERRSSLPGPVRGLLGLAARWLPDGMRGRNFLRHFSLAGRARYLDAAALFRRDDLRRLFQPDAFELVSGSDPWREELDYFRGLGGHWLSALQHLDLTRYLPLDILTKVDRMSMAHSIEARVPLLDHKFVELAARIPPELKLREGRTKHVFKQALRGVLPDEIVDRRKQGFAVPLKHWFRGQLGPFVHDLLLSDTTRRRGLINTAYVRELIQRQENGRHLDFHLWTLISFELWCRTFLDRPPLRTARPELAVAVGAR